VSDSNPCRDNSYPKFIFCGFPQFILVNAGIIPRWSYDRFLSNTFQFNNFPIIRSYNLETGVVKWATARQTQRITFQKTALFIVTSMRTTNFTISPSFFEEIRRVRWKWGTNDLAYGKLSNCPKVFLSEAKVMWLIRSQAQLSLFACRNNNCKSHKTTAVNARPTILAPF
jgi:hypothetical protein